MKKSAFSYIELMVAMALVVVVVILSAPLMTNMGKKSNPIYGEFKCYVRLVNGTWKLFQNERVNTDTYPAEDTEVEYCKFTKPAGNISSFTITLRGGGGSGSMPYFDYAKSNAIVFAPGQDGAAGEEKSIVDSLNMAFDSNGTLSIYRYDPAKENEGRKATIGSGGAVNGASSMAPKERIKSIQSKLKENNLTESDRDYISKCTTCTLSRNQLNIYLNNRTQANADKLSAELANCNGIEDKTKYTGNSGDPTKIMTSNGKYVTAAGGIYGSSDKFLNGKAYAISEFTSAANNAYYYPDNANASITNSKFTNCNGKNANEPDDVDSYENYGEGGGGGVFACRLMNPKSITLLNKSTYYVSSGTSDSAVYTNHCYKGSGGAGAGGAIIIQWN